MARAFAWSVRAIWRYRKRDRPARWRRSVEQVRTNTCPVFRSPGRSCLNRRRFSPWTCGPKRVRFLLRRMSTQEALALPLRAPSSTVVINARCSLRIEADQRVIVVAGPPVHHYRAEDLVAEAYASVFLVESGFA